MRQSIKKRLEMMEQKHTAKVPSGYFAPGSDPEFAWKSQKHFDLYEKEIALAIGTTEIYKKEVMDLHFNNARIMREKHSIRIRPERPIPACIQEMMR